MVADASANEQGTRGAAWVAPTAVLAVTAAILSFWLAGFGVVTAYRQTLRLADGAVETSFSEAELRHLTPDQRLVLLGDRSIPGAVARQQAIWTRWPTNRVYFHNTLSAALANYATLGTNDAQRYGTLAALVEKGRPLDPDNARLDWVLASKLMDQACAFKSTVSAPTAARGATVKSEMEVKDRAKLDEAMRLLSAGAAKPSYRRYSREMLAEREALLGKPRDTLAAVRRLSVAAGTLLPDLTVQRNLARGATAYASLLMAEGRAAEALPYLHAWKPLGLRLNEDAFTLVDALMVGAIFKEADVKVPELLATAESPAAATRTRGEIATLTRPIRDWKMRRDRAASDAGEAKRMADSRARGSILAAMLLPEVGVAPTDTELAPSRMLDYLLLDHACFGGLAAVLTLGLVAAAILGIVAGRTRHAPAANARESWRAAARAVIWCVLLPLVVYFTITWLTPLGAREMGLGRSWPKAVMQAAVLVSIVLVGLHRRVSLAADCAYEHGNAIGARVARFGRHIRWWVLAVCGAISLFPAEWLCMGNTWGTALALLPLAVALVSGLATLAFVISTWRRCAVRRAACVARATAVAVPTLALAVLILNLGARGLLALQERRLVAKDTLLQVEPELGGFTTLEARVARDLRDGVLQAAVMLESGGGHRPTGSGSYEERK